MTLYSTKTVGGIFIMAGTAIGAGMLALPITTGPAGLLNSIILLLLAFGYMSYTLFLLLEVTLCSKSEQANLITLVGERLGKSGQAIAWVVCLLLLYAINAAYLTAGGELTTEALHNLGVPIHSERMGALVFMALFSTVALMRTRWVDFVNRFLMLALILAFGSLTVGAQLHAPGYSFDSGHLAYLWVAIPVVFLSFSCHPVFPSICNYFNNDLPVLKRVILLGCAIPLSLYVLWEVIVIGILPQQGVNGLIAVSHSGHPLSAMTSSLEHILGLHWFGVVVAIFSYFAMSTSYLSVSLSLIDFIGDGLKFRQKWLCQIVAPVLAVLPPLIFALHYPSGFILALGYSGIFVAVLYCLFPAMMVWQARYCDNLTHSYRAFGGKSMLALTILISCLIILCELASTFKLLPVA